ncbi:MAG: hypothetical protein Q9M91_05840 [Candidatus Dojkabacteria bacterium]|nr:hypothetical protein [Candidatus Dojkabacteria bacterium]MDQ7021321.1 hypothetical protein [Candidatus Dojkabacteria bacterium]
MAEIQTPVDEVKEFKHTITFPESFTMDESDVRICRELVETLGNVEVISPESDLTFVIGWGLPDRREFRLISTRGAAIDGLKGTLVDFNKVLINICRRDGLDYMEAWERVSRFFLIKGEIYENDKVLYKYFDLPQSES